MFQGEILGLVGESGCGKSVTSLSVMRLVDQSGKTVNGSIKFQGKELLELSDSAMTKIRGSSIAMISQQPHMALNPVMRVCDHFLDILKLHAGLSRKEANSRCIELLERVRNPQAERIIDLLRELCVHIKTAIILITHDLGVVAEIAQRVAVMYAGIIVEEADVEQLYEKPLHTYTQGLMGSVPILGKPKKDLDVIPGSVPNLLSLPNGCRFAPRCRARKEQNLQICFDEEPRLQLVDDRHKVRCWLHH